MRRRIIDAAEHLLRDGKADFSMRDLAMAAGVSFATPFNQFGSKAALMHALSNRRIDTMTQRFLAAPKPPAAPDRLLLAIEIGAAVMLEEPQVNRAVMGWIGTAGPAPSLAWARSTALWKLAMGDGEGFEETTREHALSALPAQFALAFRGALSFWTAGELSDEVLTSCVRGVAETLLLGFPCKSE